VPLESEAWKKRSASTSERSRYLYDEHELEEWVPKIKQLAANTVETHAIFNNASGDYAVRNARQFTDLLVRGD
jgi:uncharacterized protein YecE (DUF72 family)